MTIRAAAPLARIPFAVCVAGLLMTTGCLARASVRSAPGAQAESCLGVQSPNGGAAPAVRWIARHDVAEREALDAWCQGVGPAVYLPGLRNSPPQGHETPIALVSWNVNVGAGDLASFVRDLQSGRLSEGRPIERFVLLLQEALRSGPTVPPSAAGQAGARRLVRSSHPIDVVRFARAAHLSLFYVPSMRNGAGRGDPAEDRGNAILSTEPLVDLRAMELPFVRQRRVVPIATIRAGGAEPLTVASVHLDPFAGPRRLWVIGAARMRGWQASAVADSLSAPGALVVGGDFNTWRGPDEPAFAEMRRISDPAPWPGHPTFAGGGVLDHLFFRLPAEWRRTYRRAPDAYGSDHFPVVGWIHARGGAPALAGNRERIGAR